MLPHCYFTSMALITIFEFLGSANAIDRDVIEADARTLDLNRTAKKITLNPWHIE
jgi:hypothetical protein